MIRISNIKIYKDITDEEVLQTAIKKHKIKEENIIEWHISKKSIDARKKDDVHYTYSIDMCVKNEEKYLKNKDISLIKNLSQPQFELNLNKSVRPVIVGAGPTGIYACYELMLKRPDLKVLLVDKGHDIMNRNCPILNKKIKKYYLTD